MRVNIIISVLLSLGYVYSTDLSDPTEFGNDSGCLTDEFNGNFTVEESTQLINRRKKVREFMNKNLPREDLETLYVPIVFHNLYKTVNGIAQNSYCDYGFDVIENNNDICNERMLRSLEVLNAQYAPSGIQFILHPYYPEMLHATDPGFDGFFYDAIGGNDNIPTPNIIKKHYNIPNSLNIYIHECLPSSTTSCISSKLGFSTYPWSLDNNEPGVFIRHKSLPGSEDIYSGAKSSEVGILAHEISHFFSIQHINGTWFTMKGNTPRELVDGNDCEIYGDLICDTPGSPGYVPLVSDTVSAWYFNNENRECIYHGYGGSFSPETGILKIGGYNKSFNLGSYPNYNYCDEWGFSDYYGLDNCEIFTNYDNHGHFFGTKGLPVECLNNNKSEYASECQIDNYNDLPLGNNFMQAGTTTLNYCSPLPIGNNDYDVSNHGFTEEQFANIRYSIENDYLGCIDSGSVNYNINALIDRGDCDCFNHLPLDECGICGGQGAIYECDCYDKDENACDCEGNTLDCAGDCGGSAVEDECSVCNGDGPDAGYDCNGDCIATGNNLDENGLDCTGVCGGSAEEDACLTCAGTVTDAADCVCDNNEIMDCAGECNGSAVEDECGVCNGDGPDAGYDCNGDCIGIATATNLDENGLDCAGDCGGNAVEDECGVCNGDGPDAGYDCIGNQLSLLNDIVPKNCSINSIYPNPFNPTTTISYSLSYNEKIQITIYNMNGRLITYLINKFQTAGYHSIKWDASNFPSGIYFINISSDKITETKKIVLIK